VDTGSISLVRGLCRQALVDRLDSRHRPDGRHRVALEERLPRTPPLRLVGPA
jgi:serine/threonine-protein kinase RsbW